MQIFLDYEVNRGCLSSLKTQNPLGVNTIIEIRTKIFIRITILVHLTLI